LRQQHGSAGWGGQAVGQCRLGRFVRLPAAVAPVAVAIGLQVQGAAVADVGQRGFADAPQRAAQDALVQAVGGAVPGADDLG